MGDRKSFILGALGINKYLHNNVEEMRQSNNQYSKIQKHTAQESNITDTCAQEEEPPSQPAGIILKIENVSQLFSSVNVLHKGKQTNILNANRAFSEIRKTKNSSTAMDKNERMRHYRICHAIAKQFDLYPELRGIMKKRWQAESMRELSDDNLRELLNYMRIMEKKALR